MPLKKPDSLTQWQWMIVRFNSGVDKRGPDECWEWKKAKVTDGYGTISLERGMPFATHRLAYQIEHGGIPSGMQVLHKCDNPPCCNPAHLFLGTHADNIQDRLNKKRNAKLTKETLESIRLDKRGQRVIADQYGITQSMVSRIKSGARWSKGFIPPSD